jgi:hypothetical protein
MTSGREIKSMTDLAFAISKMSSSIVSFSARVAATP